MSTVNGFQVGSETLKYNYESLENYNTPEFSTSKTYAVGDYVIYQGKLYKCIVEVTTAGNWNSSNWTLAVLSDDVSDLNNAIDDITSIGEYLDLSTVEMTVGSYLKTDGTIGQNDAFLLSDYIELPEGVNSVTVNRDVYTETGNKYPQSKMVFWYDSGKVYQGTGTNTFSDNLLTSAYSASNKKYIRVNFSRYKVHNFVKCNIAIPKTYKVTKDSNTGDYTSLSKCLLDLKDDHSPKIVEVWEGDYDLYAEYVELYNAGLLEIYTGNDPSLEYFNYCVWVPKNTHIIGKGIVRLKWMPDPVTDSITPVQCQCISPLNVAATATIENVEVYCKNGRYCLHNDGLGKAEFTGAVQKYINVKFYKYANDTDPVSGSEYGFKQTTGFGIDRSMHHIYYNCAFYNTATSRAFYGHSRNSVGGVTLTEAMCGDITLTNCVFESNCGSAGLLVKFGNGSNSNLHIPVLFSNCYFGDGWISLQNESSSAQTTYLNAFDVTFVNCGKYKIYVADTDNRYPPKEYDNLLADVTDVKNAIAPIENGTTTSKAYAQGAYFFHNTKFCKAITAIASGATLTLNTNYTETTVAAELLAAQN